MKNKCLAILTMLLVCSIASHAQLKRFSIGPFAEIGLPTGDFGNTNNTGYGVGVTADIKLIAGLGATGSVGYMRFGAKTNTATNTKYPVVAAFPVRVGLKYKLFGPLYVKLESGAANFTGDVSGSAVILSPGVGVRLLGLDIQGKYEAWFKDGTRGFFGLRAGFNF